MEELKRPREDRLSNMKKIMAKDYDPLEELLLLNYRAKVKLY